MITFLCKQSKQVRYNDLEEEHKQLKSELDRLKEVIDNIDNFDETAIRLMNDLENI